MTNLNLIILMSLGMVIKWQKVNIKTVTSVLLY